MHQPKQPNLYLITGVMASGKSTVAQLLAEKLDNSVHLRGDLFRRMIVNNRVEMDPDRTGKGEFEQLLLRYRLAAQAADTYVQAGFNVVVQDVVIGKLLNDFISYVRTRPLHVVVLCPNPQVVAAREAARPKTGYGAWTVEALDTVLREETPRIGMWLDSSALTPEQTVDAILARAFAEAVVN